MKRSPFACATLILTLFVSASAGRFEAQESQQPAPSQKDERAVLLKSVGLLAASQVYQAYLNVGLMADGKAAGTYQEKELRDILGSVHDLLAGADKQLRQVQTLNLSKDDRDAIAKVLRLNGLVREQSEELQAFWKTGAAARGQRYEKLRKQSWEGISTLLGLSKK